MSEPTPQRFARGSIYLVTSGEYSSYGVSGVFSTREQAEAWIDARGQRTGYGRHEIEVYPLDDPEADAPDGSWHVVVNERGAISRSAWENGEDPRKPATRIPWGAAHHFAGYGPTQEHARRAAEELRRATIAGTVVPGGQ